MAKKKFSRITVDLEQYPDMVFIELGMAPHNILGLFTVLGTLPGIHRSSKAEGVLAHNIGVMYRGLRPHFFVRQYWRSFDDLERYARGNGTHKVWWRTMVQDTRHTTIWHEAYSVRGGVDAIYGSTGDVKTIGLPTFAPVMEAKGSAYSARRRIKAEGNETEAIPLEQDT
jgi:hypothetical protein